jgi:hypothetical protein
MAYAHKLLNKIAIVIIFVIWVMEALDYSQCTSRKEVANYTKARPCGATLRYCIAAPYL